MRFNPFVEEEVIIKIASSVRSLLRRERPTSPSGALSFGSLGTMRSHARATMKKTKKFVKIVRKVIKKKRSRRTADAIIYRGSHDKLDPFMLASVGQNDEEVWIHRADGEWIKNLWLPPYSSRTVELDKYDYMTLFLDDDLIPRDHRADRPFSKAEVLLPPRYCVEISEHYVDDSSWCIQWQR